MSATVLDLEAYRKENRETGQFLDLLDEEINCGERVQPIPQDLHSRMKAIRAQAAKAHANEHLLEG